MWNMSGNSINVKVVGTYSDSSSSKGKLIFLPKGYHLDVVAGPTIPHDLESDASGSLSSWQGHPSR
jgi:hypothetical protein